MTIYKWKDKIAELSIWWNKIMEAYVWSNLVFSSSRVKEYTVTQNYNSINLNTHYTLILTLSDWATFASVGDIKITGWVLRSAAYIGAWNLYIPTDITAPWIITYKVENALDTKWNIIVITNQIKTTILDVWDSITHAYKFENNVNDSVGYATWYVWQYNSFLSWKNWNWYRAVSSSGTNKNPWYIPHSILANLKNWSLSFWVKVNSYNGSICYIFATPYKDKTTVTEDFAVTIYAPDNLTPAYQVLANLNWTYISWFNKIFDLSTWFFNLGFSGNWKTFKMYVNWVLQNTSTWNIDHFPKMSTNSNYQNLYFSINNMVNASVWYWDNIFDELYTWNRTLSDREFAELYNNWSWRFYT